MHLLQIHNYYRHAGGEEQTMNAERDLLQNHGHSVVQLTAHNNHLFRPFVHRKFMNNLKKLLKTNNFDVAHVHNVFQIIGSEVYVELHKAKIPIVQSIHNFRFFCINGLFLNNENKTCELCLNNDFRYAVQKKCYHNSALWSMLMRYQVRKAKQEVLKSVNIFVPLNNFAQQKFIAGGFPKDRLIVKPNFLFSQNNNNSTYNSYALYLGRISPEKGLDFFLQTIKSIDFQFIIAGTGVEYETLKTKFSENKNIQFVGFVSGSEKEKLINESAFMVMPSLCYENFPISILEAYQNAKAVVAPDFGSFSYNVIHNKTGLLYKQNDANSLKQTIETMIENENYIKLGKQAQQHFETNLTDKQNYLQLINIYNQAIENKRK